VKAAHDSRTRAVAERPDRRLHDAASARHPVPPNPLVAEVAAGTRVDPVEAMIDLALEHDSTSSSGSRSRPFEHESTLAMLRHPRTVVGFSDAGAHVSQMTDCSIYTHVLAHWCRPPGLTLEQAVAKMTFLPARRGLRRPRPGAGGAEADLNASSTGLGRAGHADARARPPRRAPRNPPALQRVPATVVGGQVTIGDGQHSEPRPAGSCATPSPDA